MPADASKLCDQVPLGRVWEFASDQAERLMSEIDLRFRAARLRVYGLPTRGIGRQLILNPIDYRIDWLGAASLRGDYCSPRAVALDDFSAPAEQWPKNLRRALADRIEFEDLTILRGDWDSVLGDLFGGTGAKLHRPPSREKPFWSGAHDAASVWLNENGCPEAGDGQQAVLERFVADWLESRGHEASESSIRRHVARLIKNRREELQA